MKGLLGLALSGVLFGVVGNIDRAHAETSTEVPSLARIDVSVGENKTLSAEGVQSYSEGVPGVAEIKLTPDGKEFVIVGRSPGSTTLLLIHKDGTKKTYDINVFMRPMAAVQAELSELLDGIPGVALRRVGSRFFIEGGTSSEAELERISRVAELYPGQVESLVVLGGAAAARSINIRIDFIFVQYDRSSGYNVGVQYPASLGGAGFTALDASFDILEGGFATAQAAIIEQPLPGLDIASNNGWVKVLKHSTVITANGSEATFTSGGEQNFEISQGLVATIKEIKFGTDVTVLPRFDPQTDKLEIKVQADVSDLVPPVSSATELPGRSTSTLNTSASMKLGQSLILSGIKSRSQRHNIQGLPFLSEIPVLGLLFASHADDQRDVEGAVIIVPSVVQATPEGIEEVMIKALDEYSNFTGEMEEQLGAFSPLPVRGRVDKVTAPAAR